MGSKYDPLGEYLRQRPTSEVPMSFSEIEAVIGAPLPLKAVNYPAWWSNSTSNNTMTKVWLDAGFRTERVDVGGRRLIFRRTRTRPRDATMLPVPHPSASAEKSGGLLSRLRAALAGTVRVASGVDLASSSGEAWDAEQS
jgi:hypothetical protein